MLYHISSSVQILGDPRDLDRVVGGFERAMLANVRFVCVCVCVCVCGGDLCDYVTRREIEAPLPHRPGPWRIEEASERSLAAWSRRSSTFFPRDLFSHSLIVIVIINVAVVVVVVVVVVGPRIHANTNICFKCLLVFSLRSSLIRSLVRSLGRSLQKKESKQVSNLYVDAWPGLQARIE